LLQEAAAVEAGLLGAQEGTVVVLGTGAEFDAIELEINEIALDVQNWSLEANGQFMQAAVARNAFFKLVSDINAASILSEQYGISVFARELEFLAQAGYRVIAGFAIPPI
jgi:hypothetical protein